MAAIDGRLRIRGGSMSVTFGSGRCECGCGEGIHAVAAMAGSKCCDNCTGWKAVPEPPKKPRKAWGIRVTRPDGSTKWRCVVLVVNDESKKVRKVLRWPSRMLAEREAGSLRKRFPDRKYEPALHDGVEEA